MEVLKLILMVFLTLPMTAGLIGLAGAAIDTIQDTTRERRGWQVGLSRFFGILSVLVTLACLMVLWADALVTQALKVL